MTASGAGGEANGIAEHLARVQERIATATNAAGRTLDAVTLVAVSKEVDADAVVAAMAAGQHDFGENRAQELVAKIGVLGDRETGDARAGLDAIAPRWHFIGRIQRNKIKAIAPHVTLWHSVDRAEVGAEIARHAPGARVLVQVNVSGEAAKGGCAPAEVDQLVDALRGFGLGVEGLMTVPPLEGDPRRHFAALRELAAPRHLDTLSMGMSGDFEVAIAEGSTVVRVGRAVFGPAASRAGSDPATEAHGSPADRDRRR